LAASSTGHKLSGERFRGKFDLFSNSHYDELFIYHLLYDSGYLTCSKKCNGRLSCVLLALTSHPHVPGFYILGATEKYGELEVDGVN